MVCRRVGHLHQQPLPILPRATRARARLPRALVPLPPQKAPAVQTERFVRIRVRARGLGRRQRNGRLGHGRGVHAPIRRRTTAACACAGTGAADVRDAAGERARVGVGRAAHVPELQHGERGDSLQLARERRECRVAAVVGGDALHVYSVRCMVIVSLHVVG